MRLTFLSSASALILAAAVGQAGAAPDFTGVLQVYGGAGWADGKNFGFADDPYDFGVKGQGYWSLTSDVHLQVDLFAQQTNNLVQNWPSTDATSFGGAVHLIHPFDDRWRAGIAGSIWNSDVIDLASSSGQLNVTYALGALEAQYFGRDWSLTGQGGYFDDFSCDRCFLALTSGEFARAKGRYYFDDNTALTAEAMEMWGSFDDLFFTNKSLHSTTLSLQAEHKLTGSQFASFVGLSYQRDAIDKYGSTSSLDTTTLSFGLKYYYDQASVQSNERTGADFDTPTFGSAVPVSGFLKY